MARPRTTFTDDVLRGILAAAADADSACTGAASHAAFLDHFIAGVARATGRIYGQPVYVRLLSAARIGRRPSAPTWSAAIARARVRPDLLRPVDAPSAAAPVVSGVDQRSAMVAAGGVSVTSPALDDMSDGLLEWKMRAGVAEATARDAHARLAVLENAHAGWIERATSAEAARRTAAERLAAAETAHAAQTAALLARIDALTVSVDRLSGLERHLQLQTDQMRQESAQQAQFYRARAEHAEQALAQERNQTDALRRVLGNRAPTAVG
ncbi:hypothetical protein [Paraburkholderia megapolitana]|uniref:hypothetical protein n=1 Tax=Paraburkholderia megapolitana TaxID=420953 RepID=UPI0038BD3CDC